MIHEILYSFHIIGMASIIGIGSYLYFNNNISETLRKKLALYLMSAAHTQLLTGFILFFLLLSEVNHTKVGIKMVIAIEIAVMATVYRKKIANDEKPNRFFLVVAITSAILATAIAFAV